MSYLGRGVDKISNIETLDNITFNGASSYTLQKGGVNFVPTSAAAILISIDGVVQSGNFTVSSSTIDFGTAVAGTSTCNFIIHLGTGVITAPSDGSVVTAKIADSAVATAKIADDAVTEAKLNLISTSSVPSLEAKGDGSSQDGYIQLNCSQNTHGIKLKSPPHSAGQSYTLTFPQSISADTFLKTDGSGNLSFASAGGTNTPAFHAHSSGSQVISSQTQTKVEFATELFDVGTNFASHRFTPTTAGKYYCYAIVDSSWSGSVGGNHNETHFRKNGSSLSSTYEAGSWSNFYTNTNIDMITKLFTAGLIEFNGSGDYLEVFHYSDATSPQITGCFGGYKIIE